MSHSCFLFILFFQLNDKGGPTLTTTVAMPVFSTKNETVSLLYIINYVNATKLHLRVYVL